MIKYVQGDLFQHPNIDKCVIVHACNSKGVWGSGFAKVCKDKYPNLFIEYEAWCKFYGKSSIGKSIELSGDNRDMMCLITSEGYGDNKDNIKTILLNTEKTLTHMNEHREPLKVPIISPKFNSGLFEVPWEETEKILKEFVDKYNLDWTVYY